MAREPVLVELYAGLASLSLYLCGHKPPVSRIGSKAGYTHAIASSMGIRGCDSFVLVDNDASIVQVLRTLTSTEGRDAAMDHLSRWRESQDQWTMLRRSKFDGHQETARWLYVTAGARGGVGGFKGPHKLRPTMHGFTPKIHYLIRRIGKLDLSEDRFEIRHCRAEDVEPIPGAFVYLDPPYAGRTGYSQHGRMSRSITIDESNEAVNVYRRWTSAGCTVALSESRRMRLPGRVYDLTEQRRGQSRQSMTLSTRELLYVSG